MSAVRSLHWQSSSICLLPEPVMERRRSCLCSKFATQPRTEDQGDDPELTAQEDDDIPETIHEPSTPTSGAGSITTASTSAQ